MSGKGKLSGFAWHIEYHALHENNKQANCKYLDEKRICRNRKSGYYYLSKCFDATHCPYREKKNKKENKIKFHANQKFRKIKKCSLPIGCKVRHKSGMTGRFVEYDESRGYIIIEYPDKTSKYLYPQAFTDGFLSLSDKFIHLLQKDIKESNR